MDDRSFLPQVLRVIDKAYAPGGCLHGKPGRRRAESFRYLSASWTACSKGFPLRAAGWFLKSLVRRPFPVGGVQGHRWTRSKLIGAIVCRVLSDLRTILRMPGVSIDLMLGETAGNDPFFADVVNDFYREATVRHRKWPLARAMTIGVALCRLPEKFDEYFMSIESSARRNCRKAERLGYSFRKITYNDHLTDVAEIRTSTNIRQGTVKSELLENEVRPSSNPESRSSMHDYPYFGVFKGEKLVAYAACLVAGDVCLLQHMLGHARYQADGIVPMLITGIAGHVMKEYPKVKYYAYGTFFGAGDSMRRFKKKFGFVPHRVKWMLGEGKESE